MKLTVAGYKDGMVSGTDAKIPNPQSIATRYADSTQNLYADTGN
jgi:hypothetical protein